jgi:hypothetical protein
MAPLDLGINKAEKPSHQGSVPNLQGKHDFVIAFMLMH